MCGGDDLKLYKYNYETGVEIGKNVKNNRILKDGETTDLKS